MKKVIFYIFIFSLVGLSFINGQTRLIKPLNTGWRFIIDSLNRGIAEGWEKGIPINISKTINVPHTWNVEKDLEEYIGKAWYENEIFVPTDWKAKNLILKFNAIYRDAIVYLNGKKVGENLYSGYTPFYLNISNLVVYGENNKITILVDNSFSDKALPYQKSFDWANDGGIIRPVNLIITNKPSIRYIHFTPEVNLYDSTGLLKVSIKLFEENIKSVRFKFVIKEKDNGKILQVNSATLKNNNGLFNYSISLGKIKLWHFDNPCLYEVETYIISNNTVTDNISTTIGFRKIEIKNNQLILNGERVRLPGIEYMPFSNPNYGAAEPYQFLDSVVKMMKELNVCITRFHWQQDDYILDLMDKYGILVQEELPWWQKPGNLNENLLKVAFKQIKYSIEEHYNHPCIFAWGLSNEIYSNTDKQIFKKLKEYASNFDKTRFINFVSNDIFRRREDDESLIGDIPTWNEYIGTWHGKIREELPEKFEIVKTVVGERPLLITEHGLCEPRFSGGDARRIDEMLYHIKQWSQNDFVIGYIYFCLNDYRTHMGEEGFGKFKIRRHGLTDVYLNPKPSFYVFKQLASPIEITKVVRLNSNDALLEIKVRNSIPSYTIRGYKIQYYTKDNELVEIKIPDLLPDMTYTIELKKINSRFKFKIMRPMNFVVVEY